MKISIRVILVLLTLSWFQQAELYSQTTGTGSPGLRIDVTGSNDDGDFGVAIQLVIAMTILTLGPSIIMMMTCFTRMVIVLGFVRNAIGVNAAPSSQIIVGLSLFLTFFVMGPVWNKIYDNAITWKGQPAVQVVLEDVTQKVMLEKQLLHQANYDEMTNLLNRRGFTIG